MKSTSIRTRLLALMLFVAVLAQAATYSVPKREFRSAWVATVWALDWPRDANNNEACNTNAEVQKASLCRMLDSLKNNNFNAVNFQVRSMCDAMYQSSYEPWSSYLTGKRGQAPSYDPLQFCVEECHKRGMECHAWVNPYRWSTGTDWSTQTDVDRELYNSGHLLQYGATIILDPGQQWTIDRIVNVCKEIITKYDVDGILYDDYFYPNGIPTNNTAEDYQEWVDSGTSLSFADWRRDNVNRMVKAVYDMIQETKPWVRYGISPAGVAASSSSVANKYGVDPCPAGSDWQYSGIFSDPLAWYKDQSIDYMSPQVYWKIGASADYAKITPWWGKVANKFGRHVYISSSISSIKSTSTATDFSEFANETELNRTSSIDGNFGAIYYSCKYLYALSKSTLAGHLKNTVFSKPALVPALAWKQGNNPGQVTDLNIGGGGKLSWKGYDNVRYSVYAIPATMHPSTFTKQVEYLLGMSYATEYDIPQEYQGSYWQYAVCVVDRVGNEYEPVIYGGSLEPLDNPVLISPANEATVDMPFEFKWNAVPNAQKYIVEVSNDADFGFVKESITTTETSISALEFKKLQHDTPQYWRVQAYNPERFNGVSEARVITPMLLTITYPTDGEEEVAADFTAKWYNLHSQEPAMVEISYDSDFSTIVFSGTSTTGELTLPDDALEAGNTCFIRVKLTIAGQTMTSNTVQFTVAHQAAKFVKPTNGGVLLKGDYVELKPQTWATGYQIEISTSPTTWARTRYVETIKVPDYKSAIPAEEIKVSSKLLADGTTYYARVKTTYDGLDGVSHSTEWSDVLAFTYRETLLTGDLNGDGVVNVSDVTALVNIVLAGGSDALADINKDGEVNVADVSALVNIILLGE